ncbi:Cadherin-like protein 26 [Nibea albiflora]|uniref:Cadherin-like protein 26 n=1 Tax=Nibea albiflora TaxID=240163 RepID=A0ACB7EK02_NIBAL|nr:Cadherin-like protein 26 [Nibea albiflora]
MALAESHGRRKRRSKREVLLRSKRRWVLSTIELQEEDPGPYPKKISQMFNSMTLEQDHEFRIRGMGVDEEPRNIFYIDPHTGDVFANRKIDREQYPIPFHIRFDIYHKHNNNPLDKEITFDVEIKDINDNAPKFTKSKIQVDVAENTPDGGYLPVQLQATDPDKPDTPNSDFTISLVSQKPEEPKIDLEVIDKKMAQLVLKGCFDYDYQGEVNESVITRDILRVGVDDKDTPSTDGWRAEYYFISGNEDGNYEIVTDSCTNEGILSVIKGKDYERTTLTTLQIGVRNKEPLWGCEGKPVDAAGTKEDSVNITIKVINVNDPPEFKNSPAYVYQREEEEPGKVLFTPNVVDVDSDESAIRYEVSEDPAGWVSVDKKTGQVKSVKKMDRESPFLNGTSIYKVLIHAIDDGEPPTTGTGTVVINLEDINDNTPLLVKKSVIMCGNKVNKVTVAAKDSDMHPYSGPFAFTLRGDDKTRELWKLSPDFGEEVGVVSRKRLPYGRYSVPLEIQDQQNMVGHDTLEVIEVLLRSKRRWVLSTIELQEEDPGPYPKKISQMFNNMSSEHDHEFRIRGMGVDEEPRNIFYIDPHTGDVFANRKIDREQYPIPFHIRFDIYHKHNNNPLDKELAFDVEIKDINDNAPKFTKSKIQVDVAENTPDGEYLPVQLQATDPDKPDTPNSDFTISLVSQKPEEPKIDLKVIDKKMAQLVLKGCFDYDYQGEVNESAITRDILRVRVDDKDTPNTDGWRAEYYFISGNEDGNYEIVTDSSTNEGILSVIKGKDYERTTLTTLQIGVRNKEPLWSCEGKPVDAAGTKEDSVNITIKVIDVNDPPEFKNSPAKIYQKEEEEPGKVLFTPEVVDVDSDESGIRYEVFEDPAGWVSVDKKTGQVKSVKKMDRESPFLNGTSIYKVLIHAIDDGEPPTTGTGTVLINLGDINDNTPLLVNKSVILCGNKDDKVTVAAKDSDVHPYSGPFSFTLRGDDKTRELWKLSPDFGEEVGIVSQEPLPYGNYSLTLEIQDQQNMVGHDTLEVIVCDCGKKDVCRSNAPISTSFGVPGIGLVIASLLLFLLLLIVFVCHRGMKDFNYHIQEEGNQTLINYNQEGGSAECKTDPALLLTPTNTVAVTNQHKLKQASGQTLQSNSNMTSMGMHHQRGSLKSYGQTPGGSSKYNRSISLVPGQQIIEDHLQRTLGVHRSSSEILQRQKRNWIIDSFSIDEGYDGPFPYSLGVVKVDNQFTKFEIHGEGVEKEPKGILQIDEKTGEVTVHGPVDYETYKVLKCTFQAFDVQKQVVDTKLGIEIVIKDANDNAPKFSFLLYEIRIAESTMQGTEVVIISASDSDFTESNKKINFKILSVIPEPKDLEFYLISRGEVAAISFHGCLDHETTDKYTIIVEAKDNGEKKQLSSSTTVIITIEDGNNHIPEIIGITGPGKVKEGVENVLVSRLLYKDADAKGTEAWKALYKIHGDTHNNFKISTDPETNDGLLYVQKHLDFESTPLKNVTISVENEILSHSCQLISRGTTGGEWKVQMSTGVKVGSFSISGGTITGISITGTTMYGTSVTSSTFSGTSNKGGGTASGGIVKGLGISTYVLTLTVEDVNEAPVFKESNLRVTLSEFVKVGYYLQTVTAKDPDTNTVTTSDIRYIIGHDPAKWITVDSVTGNITTIKDIDRESKFVVNNIYTITVLAVDKGNPQMTGTATLSIKITDENDNVPSLTTSIIDMCHTDGPSLANITAVDLDEDPYSGPFNFKLLGDVEGKWKFKPSQGYSVDLVKDSTVHSGTYNLLVQVSDLQEENSVYNLTVTVCNCVNPAMPDLLLLLAFMVSCKKKTIPFPDGPVVQELIKSNIEEPGTDCQVQQKLEAPEEELGDYDPHVYAEEGDMETLHELDAISVADTSLNLDLDLNLNYKFNTLASICMPRESTACSGNTYYVSETLNTATEIQTESQSTNMNTQLLSTNYIFDQVISPTF